MEVSSHQAIPPREPKISACTPLKTSGGYFFKTRNTETADSAGAKVSYLSIAGRGAVKPHYEVPYANAVLQLT